VPPRFLPLMCSHPKTDEAVQQLTLCAATDAVAGSVSQVGAC
jgi:hypothetical protein